MSYHYPIILLRYFKPEKLSQQVQITHFKSICEIFLRKERHPFWHTNILGPISNHIKIYETHTPRKDLMYNLWDASYIYPLVGLHDKNHS